MTTRSISWLDQHREKLIARGKTLAALTLLRQFLFGAMLLSTAFLFLNQWRG